MLALLLFLGLAMATVLLAFSAAVLGGSRAGAMLNTARRTAGTGIKQAGRPRTRTVRRTAGGS
jgi:hypothetical protein